MASTMLKDAAYFDNVITKFIVNNKTDALKTDINLLFTITNCQIVRSRSLTHRINYKFMCLPLIDNERARISAFIVKILVTMQLLGFTFVLLFSPCELSWVFHKSTLGKHIDWYDLWILKSDCEQRFSSI